MQKQLLKSHMLPLMWAGDRVLMDNYKHKDSSLLAQSPIKWPGGKSKEYLYIKHLIPKFDRYIEPFFGGGAIFFKLQPTRSIINDFSKDLMEIYKYLKGDLDLDSFSKALYEYVDNWEKVPTYISLFEDELLKIYRIYQSDDLELSSLTTQITQCIQTKKNQFNGLFDDSFCLDSNNLMICITRNLISKIVRMKKIETEKGKLSLVDLDKNIETAFRSGFYMHFRDLMNGRLSVSATPAKKAANYYFIREFCYGAMFRFNSKGEFNIPYGGIAYNSKNFRKKVDAMLTDQFRHLFKNTIIEVGDFEDVFQKYTFTKSDFVFLDPPYDSDFSDYDNQSFGAADHIRLAKILYKTPANFLLIIKETPFIRSLYSKKPNIKIESFEKKYLYNVKGRNNQDAMHLIIYNC